MHYHTKSINNTNALNTIHPHPSVCSTASQVSHLLSDAPRVWSDASRPSRRAICSMRSCWRAMCAGRRDRESSQSASSQLQNTRRTRSDTNGVLSCVLVAHFLLLKILAGLLSFFVNLLGNVRISTQKLPYNIVLLSLFEDSSIRPKSDSLLKKSIKIRASRGETTKGSKGCKITNIAK